MELVKIGLFGIVGVLIALQFKQQKVEVSMYIGLAIALVMFHYVLSWMFVALSQFEAFQKYIGQGSEYLKILLKVVGITYICEFSSGICKDAGYQTIAGQIEIFGKISILAISSPIILALLETIYSFL